MPEEGVVRFAVDRRDEPLEARRFGPLARLLTDWRRALQRLGLVGRDPRRYQGYAYGNLSARLPPWQAADGRRSFLITGTQTGGQETIGLDDFSLVRRYDATALSVACRGRSMPSSESLTHGAVYDLDPRWRFVFHVHSPEIWRAAKRLDLPATGADAECGTAAMAAEVRRLADEGRLRGRRVFVMAGHEDGVVAFGRTADEAGGALTRALAAT